MKWTNTNICIGPIEWRKYVYYKVSSQQMYVRTGRDVQCVYWLCVVFTFSSLALNVDPELDSVLATFFVHRNVNINICFVRMLEL